MTNPLTRRRNRRNALLQLADAPRTLRGLAEGIIRLDVALGRSFSDSIVGTPELHHWARAIETLQDGGRV